MKALKTITVTPYDYLKWIEDPTTPLLFTLGNLNEFNKNMRKYNKESISMAQPLIIDTTRAKELDPLFRSSVLHAGMGIKFNNNSTITDYKVINNKVVIVTFADGTTEKAVCSDEDFFDLDKAIEICALKHKLGGTRVYNETIRKALKDVESIDKKRYEDKLEEERVAKQKVKYAERKAKRMEKREEAKRQEQIDIQSAAFLKAMQDYDNLQIGQNLDDFNEEVDRLSYLDKTECEPTPTTCKEN